MHYFVDFRTLEIAEVRAGNLRHWSESVVRLFGTPRPTGYQG